uniref:Uncharacterized protein n=1 Tax=Chromera velia CCMP2878 TaxID=1169474 RepID=A0A0G4IDG1_9ALVE|eukprot:Cvel_13369.t1-p1 / transcript=Cvel_13369.t1 / gene=Cvel_13369 / organism=Chromera_velia_CCMP2878 / gene_product=hypothetical protein / transcript_product=hypothetical protein / location=Cvel_scaffold909:33875-34174(-) / protein_length=100 / sequence_SO=supercontig / SO=protein_coding / is_pseudo=false
MDIVLMLWFAALACVTCGKDAKYCYDKSNGIIACEGFFLASDDSEEIHNILRFDELATKLKTNGNGQKEVLKGMLWPLSMFNDYISNFSGERWAGIRPMR